MSTRPKDGASSKLSSSLDDLIKSDRKGDRGGAVRKERGGRDSKPYSRPEKNSTRDFPREPARHPLDRGDSGDGGGGGEASVYVGNLPWSTDSRALKAHMRSAGEVVRADIIAGGDGRSRGFGIVEFSKKGAARKAISTLNESELDGRTITVREDRGGRDGGGGGGGGGSLGGRGRGGGFGGRRESDSFAEEDPVYSASGITGRNGWVRPTLDDFVDAGPPPEPKGSMLR